SRRKNARKQQPRCLRHARRKLARAAGAQALAVRVDLAVRFQTRQPQPGKRANQLQVFQARIPTVEDHASGLKATLWRLCQQGLEVIVLAQRVLLLSEDALV